MDNRSQFEGGTTAHSCRHGYPSLATSDIIPSAGTGNKAVIDDLRDNTDKSDGILMNPEDEVVSVVRLASHSIER